jgi:signal transduction histidine kinase
MTVPAQSTRGATRYGRWGTARLMARPGVAVAASAPVALVALSQIPAYRPADLAACVLSVVAVGVLVLAAELACFDPGDRPSRLDDREATPYGWSDPAMVSVGRWLAQWPGIAGVSAASWWAARIGGAGLLCRLAQTGAGAPFHGSGAAALMLLAMIALATFSVVPGGRHLAKLALGIVAVAGLVVTGSGLVAARRGQLNAPLLPAGPLLSSGGPTGGVAVEAANTMVLLCLAAICLVAVTPATSMGTGRRPGRTTWLTVGAAVTCWVFAVPALLRTTGFDFYSTLVRGSSGSVRSALAIVLAPLGGSHATSLAGWLLFAVCLAGAFGALSGGTSLAAQSLSAATGSARARRHVPPPASAIAPQSRAPQFRAPQSRAPQSRAPQPTSGSPTSGAQTAGLPRAALLGSAALSGLVAGGIALSGERSRLLIAIGCLSAAALALTTLAPPVLRQCQRVPALVRVVVATIWVLVETLALGASSPLALVTVGLAALAGAFAMGWKGLAGTSDWTKRRLALPWGTAAAALVTTSAVTTLELLPAGMGESGAAMWRGLAVVVMGAGIVLLAVLPATSRLRVEHLGASASALSERALPALAKALEALARGGSISPALPELSELKAATRPLEAELGAHRAPDEMLKLTKALVDASHQVLRMASVIEAASRLDRRRLEELVEERIAALSVANRNLVDSQWRRRQLLDRTVRVAEGERARIAANLHDGPIQRLAALGLILDRCEIRLDRDEAESARELVVRARGGLSDEIHNLREMMSELRPPILDEGGLDAALRDQVSGWSATTGIDGSFETAPHAPLSPDSETVVYRVVQEALANVAKHARASLTTVSLTQSGAGVRVVVWDNGKGFHPREQHDLLRRGHFGLVVMRERVELASGRFEVKSAPLTGTQVIAWVPIDSVNQPDDDLEPEVVPADLAEHSQYSEHDHALMATTSRGPARRRQTSPVSQMSLRRPA